MAKPQVAIVKTQVRLPFHKNTESSHNGLDWTQFENLCLDVWSSKEKKDGKTYGRQGQAQHGIDFQSLLDDSYFGQCKCEATFGLADLKTAVDKYQKGSLFNPSADFAIWVATDVADVKFDDAVKKYRASGLKIVVNDAKKIEELICSLDNKLDLVKKYWGESFANDYCGLPRETFAISKGVALHAGGEVVVNFSNSSTPVPKGAMFNIGEGIGKTNPGSKTTLNFK
jgi:hypothetical protein